MQLESVPDLASYIDHTLLKPEATPEQIVQLCTEAKFYKFKGVCVNSWMIPAVIQEFKNDVALPIAVIGFPLGSSLTEVKVFEAGRAEALGAKELDMVINLGALKSGQLKYVESDISSVCKAISLPVKVILETGLLNLNEIELCCKIAKSAGAAFVKTCTGFNVGSATVEHILLMRKTVGPNLGVKASGGIKTREQAEALIRAGANRIGTSSGIAIVNGEIISKDGY
jgi:deoxyribose-phosphate aldolase